MFEHRVVVPPTLRHAILKDLHAAHLGIVKMKAMARSFVFWPGIDTDIENVAKSCTDCIRHAHVPPKFREHHWEYPKAPWERIHIDYAGPVADKMLLIIVDAYSKWLEVRPTTSTTATATITILDDLFTAYGVPVTVVSDNGRQFIADDFKSFLRNSGVKYHNLSAPYHPSTNGQAERYIQTVKDALYAMKTTKETLRSNLNEFLRQYRKAPHSVTMLPPARLFLGRDLRTRLDLTRPDDVQTRVTQKHQANMSSTFRILNVGQDVYFLSGNKNMDKWLPGVMTARLGDLHYEIKHGDKTVKRHIDQIRMFAENIKETGVDQQRKTTPEEPILRRIRFHGQQGDSPVAAEPTLATATPVLSPTQETARADATERDQVTPVAPRRSSITSY
ncbi:uncharacterized protein K02A2.6-like [Photinus pyralis]|uniref:uncharacterized protein K02A2.6-like n=1 Tax=Photinus pyralis TaxID=7054 RepID=UPI0012673932|nr:uncharacterized protein K02A2.6-like [Photinus pyralis]XP_031338491.1 uncharacterized protein K02A2.6-like [Photinus pyralis]XP_031350433.1 uncharacterized protein K02A2.6-like [Photinus pyralis]